MNESCTMCAVQHVSDRKADSYSFVQRQWAAFQPLRQRFAFGELRDQEVGFPFAANLVKGGNVRMIQGGNDLKFAIETLTRLRVLQKTWRQKPHKDGTTLLGIRRLVDFLSAQARDGRNDFIGAKTTPRLQRHKSPLDNRRHYIREESRAAPLHVRGKVSGWLLAVNASRQTEPISAVELHARWQRLPLLSKERWRSGSRTEALQRPISEPFRVWGPPRCGNKRSGSIRLLPQPPLLT